MTQDCCCSWSVLVLLVCINFIREVKNLKAYGMF